LLLKLPLALVEVCPVGKLSSNGDWGKEAEVV